MLTSTNSRSGVVKKTYRMTQLCVNNIPLYLLTFLRKWGDGGRGIRPLPPPPETWEVPKSPVLIVLNLGSKLIYMLSFTSRGLISILLWYVILHFFTIIHLIDQYAHIFLIWMSCIYKFYSLRFEFFFSNNRLFF